MLCKVDAEPQEFANTEYLNIDACGIVRISVCCKTILTIWGQVMHICISKLDQISSDNDLSPVRCQAMTFWGKFE